MNTYLTGDCPPPLPCRPYPASLFSNNYHSARSSSQSRHDITLMMSPPCRLIPPILLIPQRAIPRPVKARKSAARPSSELQFDYRYSTCDIASTTQRTRRFERLKSEPYLSLFLMEGQCRREHYTRCFFVLYFLFVNTSWNWMSTKTRHRNDLLILYYNCSESVTYLLCGERHWTIYSASKNIPPDFFDAVLPNVWEFLVQILRAYTTTIYAGLPIFIQLSATLTKLCHIKHDHHCSKRPPSVETHAGWSHLIWHNFVTVRDNWTKICNLA